MIPIVINSSIKKMKINQVTYYDKELEWQYEPINFSELNLLVGISGVGKTQILKSIMRLRKIAKGASLNGVKWNINFSIANNAYNWKGEFETSIRKSVASIIEEEQDTEESDKPKYRIINEYLSLDDRVIVERNNNQINFNGTKLPKLSLYQSLIEILGEEDDIAPVKKGFDKIIYSDQSEGDSINRVYPIIYASLKQKRLSLEHLQVNNLPIPIKLAYSYNNIPEIFNKIKAQFIQIFPQVEDIKIEPNESEYNSFSILTEYPFIHIKERDVNNWVGQGRISSGMLRTLMHISELYLSSDGTVILIDEFENSLGINCIDIVSDLLLENRNLQFILTSHHPYIINKIGMEYWKIITRKGGVVTARDVKDFNLPKSRHQAFMQLINLDAYREGIAV
jgi:ABC-type dipeptide/oligopeptide/nickel transport system ATPase component